MGGTVKFNFGPNFKYPPSNLKYSPMCMALPPSEPLPPDEIKQEEAPLVNEILPEPIENTSTQ
jgi:hypothetical protein